MTISKKAVAFTAYNRLSYLSRVLETWREVDDLHDWHFYFSVDPSPQSEHIVNAFAQFARDTGMSDYQIGVHKRKLGVLHHPWVAFDQLFKDGAEFVVRVEDDLLVSNDFLQYMDWSRQEFKDNSDVAAVIGYSEDYQGDDHEVVLRERFSPWNWGTWKDRWDQYIRDTWDHDYSTFNDRPGYQAGWDWNLDTRVLPERGKSCAYPAHSRVQNIGQVGTHAMPHDFPQSISFQKSFERGEYFLGR